VGVKPADQDVSADDLSREQLLQELSRLRRRVAQLEQAADAEEGSWNEAYRTLVDRSLQGLLIYADGGILFANRTASRITGYAMDELFGMEPDLLVHPDDRRRLGPTRGAGVSQESIRLLAKDGGSCWVELTAHPITHLDRPAVQVVFMDISERVVAEERLREVEQNWRALIHNAPQVVALVDREERVEYINRPVGGQDPAGMVGASIYEFIPEPMHDRFGAVIREVLQECKPVRHESCAELSGGRRVWYDCTAIPVHRGGEVASVLYIATDVTARRERRSEEEAVEEERRRIAREIHDGLAQDLAALSLRLGLCQELVRRDPARAEADLEEMKGLLRTNLQEVRRLILALRPLDLDRLGFFPALRRFAADFGDHNGLQVELRVQGQEGHLPSGLEPELFRMIQEALHNVAKHADARTVQLELHLSPAEVGLQIRDDGRGFDPRLLERSIRRGRVGLRQMQERVSMRRGLFSLDSGPGRGTTIQVLLPVEPDQPEDRDVRPPRADR
jgi:PAS domain S-box-containing protein